MNRGIARYLLIMARAARKAWDVASVICTGLVLLTGGLIIIAFVIGGIAAMVWMYRHDGPARFATNLLIWGVMYALVRRGIGLLDRRDRSRSGEAHDG